MRLHTSALAAPSIGSGAGTPAAVEGGVPKYTSMVSPPATSWNLPISEGTEVGAEMVLEAKVPEYVLEELIEVVDV